MFEAAQWALSSKAANSLAQMAARQAKGDGALAGIVRERQDLVGEWQARDKLLVAAIAQSPDQRNAISEQTLRDRIAKIDVRIAEIDKTLAKDFPEYAALASPEPLGIADVQAQLHANEALVLFLDTVEWKPTPEETFLWVVNKTAARWLRIELGTRALNERVAALRCGLDRAAWDDDGARCARLLNYVGINASNALPFDLGRAYELYTALFAQVEDLIKDKHLLVVPSGALTSLPFQVLVTEKPTGTGSYADATWLTRHHAITVLPSAASLKALRQFAKATKATRPFVGFGNPLLVGPSGADRSAWTRQSCAKAPELVRVASRAVRAPIAQFFRGHLADADFIRRQQPLPETTDELCAVAQSVGAAESAIYLGDKATERVVKSLSADGTLAQARSCISPPTVCSAAKRKCSMPPKRNRRCYSPLPTNRMTRTMVCSPPRKRQSSSSMPIGSCSRPATRQQVTATRSAPRRYQGSLVHSSTPARAHCSSRTGRWIRMLPSA